MTRSHRPSSRTVLAVVLGVVLSLAGSLAPASADEVAEHPDPGVVRPHPAPGAVVSDGAVALEALLHARQGVRSAELRLGGSAVGAAVDQVSTHTWRIRADVELAEGRHIAEVRFTDGQDRTTRRAWEFNTSSVGFGRLAGADRIATSVEISRDLYPGADSASAAVLARADDFADALSGAPAAAQVDGPLLLTARDRLSPAAADELRRVLPSGATVYLLGGEAALSSAVADAVADLGDYRVVRRSGGDRYATSTAVLDLVPESSTAFVASGQSFPDALSASAPAARDRSPILLTHPDRVPDTTREVLEERAFDTVYLVGGTAVVGPAVEGEIAGLAGRVVRIAGADRYQTADRVAHRLYGDDVSRVAIASGERFPDALSGGPHAGRNGVPLVLSPGRGLARPQVDRFASWRIDGGWLYGGSAVLTDRVAHDVRRAIIDGAGPRETSLDPAPGSEINALDTVVVRFDREVDLDASTVYVEVDGREVYGVLAQGDFASELVFRAGALPFDPTPNEVYPGRVWVLAKDGSHVRHLEWDFTLRTLDISRGDVGASVQALQDRLTSLGYWLGTADGQYGSLTSQAVMAFQKYEGLPRTGSVDQATRDRLSVADRPRPRNLHRGRYVEIDKTRQVMMFVLDGRVEWTMNTSTGTETYYYQDGQRKLAHTPEGTFRFSRQIDGMRNAPLGQMWRPKYFTSAGHAIHGSTSIPAHPASHGCARLSYPAIDFVWAADLAPIGTTLYVYR